MNLGFNRFRYNPYLQNESRGKGLEFSGIKIIMRLYDREICIRLKIIQPQLLLRATDDDMFAQGFQLESIFCHKKLHKYTHDDFQYAAIEIFPPAILYTNLWKRGEK